jgi:gamma-glutamylcyclotransferase (GGCT)/AIG2-like uncharacterized protein YtfP
VIEPIDEALWRCLDAFESRFYERCIVTLETPDTPALAAYAYVVAAEHRHLLTGEPWTPERFAADHLDAYLARHT